MTRIRVLLAQPAPTTIEGTLRDRGMDVTVVHDHVNAVDSLAAQRFDVVVLDSCMDHAHCALRDIRGVDATTPILLLVMGAELAGVVQVLRPGMADFLLQPCPPEALIAAIENASERESVPPAPAWGT